MENHFNKIAERYRQLRTTDIEPILYIKKELDTMCQAHGADVGCGAGRYTVRLAKQLGNKCGLLYCIDKSTSMLMQLKGFFKEHGINHFKILHGDAHEIPLKTNSMDFVVSFNAVHHFDLSKFLIEASRVLKNKSRLFIYTRLKSQNAKNIWGYFFPDFAKKETRLYELDQLQRAISSTTRLSLREVKFFEYDRTSTLWRLEEQAKGYHYSTFRLYSKNEFNRSLQIFRENIMKNYDPDNVHWKDENVLLVVES